MSNRIKNRRSSMLDGQFSSTPGPGREEVPWSEWVISSSASEDRDGDVVAGLRGWQTSNWVKQGAPVLLDHNEHQSQPIGTAIHPIDFHPHIWTDGTDTFCRVWHDLSTPVGRDAWALVEKGLLNGASIGFIPLKKTRRQGKRGYASGEHGGPWNIDELELVEVSLTPCPSQPRCVGIGASKSANRQQWLMRKSVTGIGKKVEEHGQIMLAWRMLQRIGKKITTMQAKARGVRSDRDTRISVMSDRDTRISVMSNFHYIPGG
jgi:Caudovirus prohead serine protease